MNWKFLPFRARGINDRLINRGFKILSPDALQHNKNVTRSLSALKPLADFSDFPQIVDIFSGPSLLSFVHQRVFFMD